MDEATSSPNDARTPPWLVSLLPIAGVLAGGAVFALTWLLFRDRVTEPDFPWHGWITPGLLALASALFALSSLVALVNRRSGVTTFWAAASLLPVVLAVRLVIVIGVLAWNVIGWIGDGTLADRLGNVRLITFWPLAVVIVVSIIAALVRGRNEQE